MHAFFERRKIENESRFSQTCARRDIVEAPTPSMAYGFLSSVEFLRSSVENDIVENDT
jgi:hypothetical protein